MVPVAQRVLGESNDATLKMRVELRGGALQRTSDATLDDVREAATTFEETARMRGACWWRTPNRS